MPNDNYKINDESRIIRAARKDPRVFGDLYQLYVRQVYRYLCSRLENVQEAEDVTAQTFLKALESFDSYREDGYFASWLFTIARNKAVDHFRRRKNFQSLNSVDGIPVNEDPLAAVILSEQALIVSKLIGNLSEEEQELLRLRFLAEMSFPDMAHFLHRNEEAVKKATYRLLARLQGQLETANE